MRYANTYAPFTCVRRLAIGVGRALDWIMREARLAGDDVGPIFLRHDALAVITADGGLNHGERRP